MLLLIPCIVGEDRHLFFFCLSRIDQSIPNYVANPNELKHMNLSLLNLLQGSINYQKHSISFLEPFSPTEIKTALHTKFICHAKMFAFIFSSLLKLTRRQVVNYGLCVQRVESPCEDLPIKPKWLPIGQTWPPNSSCLVLGQFWKYIPLSTCLWTREGVTFTKIIRGCACQPWKSEFLYTDFLPNFPPISIPFQKKHPILTKLGALYNNMPKIKVIWALSSRMKTPQSLYQILQKSALKGRHIYTYTMSMWEPPWL